MNMAGYLRKRRWTPIEVAIWLIALLALIVGGILFATSRSGSWAILVSCVLVVVLALVRYRVEAKRVNQNARDSIGR